MADEELLTKLVGPDCHRRRVLLDLSDVSIIDSSGVGWLLGRHKRFRAAGGVMVLFALGGLSLALLQARPWWVVPLSGYMYGMIGPLMWWHWRRVARRLGEQWHG